MRILGDGFGNPKGNRGTTMGDYVGSLLCVCRGFRLCNKRSLVAPHDQESNGQENSKLNGNWEYIGVSRVYRRIMVIPPTKLGFYSSDVMVIV